MAPHQNPADQTESAPPEMRETRFVAMPENVAMPQDYDPDEVVAVSAQAFFAVLRELTGSQQGPFRAYARKLQAAIRADAGAALEQRATEAYDIG